MIISWEQIRQVVELFSDNHLMIKRFYSDYEDQLSTYSTLGEDFPVLYMTPVDGVMGYTQNSLNIRFYCFDRIIRDRSNWNGIVSDTHRCLNDLYKFLQSPSVELIDTELEANILPINDATMDYVAGWFIDIEVSLDTYSDCFIMVDDIPVFSWSGKFGIRKQKKDVGVMYLKFNNIPTPITAINQRKVVSGTMDVGTLDNFIKDPTTNSLKYVGTGGRFHAITTFNFYEGSQRTCGFYIGHNKIATSSLDPDGDRISESEIYINSSTPSNQPIGGAIQTILDLKFGDRVFFIVQNKDAATNITVEFMKLIVMEL
jgi:hypothetical protein